MTIKFKKVIVEAERDLRESIQCDNCGMAVDERKPGWYQVIRNTKYAHETERGDYCSLECLLKDVPKGLHPHSLLMLTPVGAGERVVRNV